MKKILLFLAVMLVASVCYAQTSMDGLIFGYKHKGNEMYYEIKGSNVWVTSQVKSATLSSTVEIPSEVTHKGKRYRVYFLGNNAIVGPNKIEKLVIPGSVERVRMHSIVNCPNLREVRFEPGVGSISGEVFENCPKVKTIYVHSSTEITNENWYKEHRVKIVRY
ncbi:MAG: leucine-rich repeat protein [Bacteroidales bacterium]|nr:leucine-rich repeat protein [Bacteroidales bacterium]